MRKLKKLFSFIIVLSFMLSISVGAFAEEIVLDKNGTPIGSSTEWNYDLSHDTLVIESGSHAVTGGSFGGIVDNYGTITGGDFTGNVYNYSGSIEGGDFSGQVDNRGSITDGNFTGDVFNSDGGKIEGGEFSGNVVNNSSISGGNFSGYVYNYEGGSIEGGEFSGYVDNNKGATIKDGNFSGAVFNYEGATITGGNFTGTLQNYGTGFVEFSESHANVDNSVRYLPVKLGDKSINLTAGLNGDCLMVWDADLSSLLRDHEIGSVSIDLSALKVRSLSLSETGIELLAEAIGDGELEIIFADGPVTFNAAELLKLSPDSSTSRILLSLN